MGPPCIAAVRCGKSCSGRGAQIAELEHARDSLSTAASGSQERVAALQKAAQELAARHAEEVRFAKHRAIANVLFGAQMRQLREAAAREKEALNGQHASAVADLKQQHALALAAADRKATSAVAATESQWRAAEQSLAAQVGRRSLLAGPLATQFQPVV